MVLDGTTVMYSLYTISQHPAEFSDPIAHDLGLLLILQEVDRLQIEITGPAAAIN